VSGWWQSPSCLVRYLVQVADAAGGVLGSGEHAPSVELGPKPHHMPWLVIIGDGVKAPPLRGAAGRQWRPASGLGEAPAGARRHALSPPLIYQAHRSRTGAGRCRLPRRFIVSLPAAVSRSLPAVASHAIGFAEPRHDVHSPGIGTYRGRRGKSRQAGESHFQELSPTDGSDTATIMPAFPPSQPGTGHSRRAYRSMTERPGCAKRRSAALRLEECRR
jgi:hypothetical protein